jgi:hypothetical protein
MKALGLVLFVFTIMLAGTSVTSAQQSKDVTVVNPPDNPVNVRSVDDPARRAFHAQFEVNTPNPVVVPAGKIFVVEHVSGSFRLKTIQGATTPCKFYELALPNAGVQGIFIPINFTPTDMGTAASVGFDVSFYTLNNPMKFYVRPGAELGPMNFSIGGSCPASPILNSRIVLSGYLVDM